MHSDHACDGPTPGDIAHALAVIRKALDTAATQAPSHAKTALLQDLSRELHEIAKVAQTLRREEMKRIRDEQSLSLSQLGEQWHVSKQRANQIVNGRKTRKRRESERNA